MDIRTIKKLVEILEASHLNEIEITEGESTIRISRGMTGSIAPVQSYTAPLPAAPVQASAQHNIETPASQPTVSGHQLKSPMVGTFYSASSPGTPPFATIGKNVQAGETVCIIEAMKMFNEIEADKTGIIKAILVENGEPVEYGQPLFIIE